MFLLSHGVNVRIKSKIDIDARMNIIYNILVLYEELHTGRKSHMRILHEVYFICRQLLNQEKKSAIFIFERRSTHEKQWQNEQREEARDLCLTGVTRVTE